MKTEAIIGELRKSRDQLNSPIAITWRYPKRTPANPLTAKPKKDWTEYKPGPGPWKKNDKNWFYGELKFPAKHGGIAVAGTEAELYITGWQPFTLWIDGKEMYREEHAWMATGPIVDPLPIRIQPGQTHALIMCVEPSELPAGSISLSVKVQSKVCGEIAIEMDAAAAQLELAGVLETTKAEKAAVAAAAACFREEDFSREPWAAIAESIRAMETALTPLSPKAKALTVHLLGHAHIDMDWMWTWEDTVHCIRRDFKAVTEIMDDYPDVTFVHSQVPTYEVTRQMDPGIFKDTCKRIAEGRWENAAATWVEGDLNMAEGETLVRQMQYAREWTRKHLGNEAEVFWAPDTFGHPGNMPQLAVSGGFTSYFQMRCNPGEYNNWPVRLWTGIDGTVILALSKVYSDDLVPAATMHTLLENLRFGIHNSLHVWGIGDHGGAMSRKQLGILETYRHKPLMPEYRFSTVKDYCAALKRDKAVLPGNQGETYSLFEGCFTTHAEIKRYNRLCENMLLDAEALTAMAGRDRTRALREGWIPALFNQFHDIIDGSSTHNSYTDAYTRAEASCATAGKVCNESVHALTVQERGYKGVSLLNPLGFPRTEPVRTKLPKSVAALQDKEGTIIPVQHSQSESIFIAEDVPAFGLKGYEYLTTVPKGTVCQPSAVDVREHMIAIETNYARIQISRKSGIISSYYDKQLKRELVSYGLIRYMTWEAARRDLGINVFQIIDESPVAGSAWLINDIQREENLVQGATVEVKEQGQVFTRIRVNHTVRSSRITEDIIIYNDYNRIDFDLEIDWRERGSREKGVPQLKLSFAAGMRKAQSRSEGPFCVTERPADGMEYPTQKFVSLCGEDYGFTVLNDSKYGYDALGSRLRMTLLRNACDPDLDSDNGIHRIKLAFIPHPANPVNADLVRVGMGFNRPVKTAVNRKPKSTAANGFRIEGSETIVCTSLRNNENRDGIVIRLFETSGTEQTATVYPGIAGSRIREIDFTGKEQKKLLQRKDGGIGVTFKPWEVKTVVIG